MGSWTLLTPTNLPEAKCAMAGHNFNGIVSYAGGRINTGASRATNELYVVNTNNFTTGTETAIPAVRGGMAYAGYSDETGSYLFLVGGASAVTPAVNFFSLTAITFVPQASSFYAYTPPASTNGWFTGTYHPAFTGGTATGILFGSAVVSQYNGSTSDNPTLYVFGGLKDSPPVTVTDVVYSTTAVGTTSGTNYIDGGWATRTVMPRPRYGHSSVTVNQ